MRYITALLFLLATSMASADTTITYQGQLQDGNGPVDATVNMIFALFDAETDGNPIGTPISLTGVSVVDGLFQIELDFGEQAYAGGLWLAIEVDNEPLAPRQAITGAPFAISVAPGTGSNWELSGSNIYYSGGKVGIGTSSPTEALHVDGNIRSSGDLTAGGNVLVNANQSGFSYIRFRETGFDTPRIFHNNIDGGLHFADFRALRVNAPILALQGMDVGGTVNASGDIAVNADASEDLSYIRFRGSSGTNVPRIYHRESDKKFFFSHDLFVFGDIGGTGAKSFIQPHREDPSSEIHYIAVEAGEAGVYWRGSGRTENGRVVIDLPEHFRLVASEDFLTSTVTPRDRWAPLYVEELTPSRIVVALDTAYAEEDVAFDFMVNGVRRHYEDRSVIRPNSTFRPDEHESLAAFERAMGQTPEVQAMLIENGVLKEDGTSNRATMEALGWSIPAEIAAEDIQRDNRSVGEQSQ